MSDQVMTPSVTDLERLSNRSAGTSNDVTRRSFRDSLGRGKRIKIVQKQPFVFL